MSNRSEDRPLRFPDPGDGVLYHSRREGRLRLLTLCCFAVVPLVAWPVLRAPRAEWEQALGPALWWLFPSAFIALSLALPAAMFFLHDRYVLRLEAAAGGGMRLVTFLVWGRRTRELPAGSFAKATVRQQTDRYSKWISVDLPGPSGAMARGLKLIFDAGGRDSREILRLVRQLRKRS
ncbi:MAG: hypothetical protein ACREIA_09745 [Opitutaceae bacterium]